MGDEEHEPDTVITPGGERATSKVHHVGPGQHVSQRDGRLLLIETATGRVIEDLGDASGDPA